MQNHKINQEVAHSISRAKNFHKQNLEIYRPQLTTAKDDSYLDSRKTRIREVLSEERFPGFGIVQIKCHSVRSVKLLHICPYLKYVIIDIILQLWTSTPTPRCGHTGRISLSHANNNPPHNFLQEFPNF